MLKKYPSAFYMMGREVNAIPLLRQLGQLLTKVSLMNRDVRKKKKAIICSALQVKVLLVYFSLTKR